MNPEVPNVLERNVGLLLRRAYMPARPKPDFRAELEGLIVSEVHRLASGRRRGAATAASPTRRIASGLAWAAGFAALLLLGWQLLDRPADPRADLLARGQVVVSEDGGAWRAASRGERTEGLMHTSESLAVATPAEHGLSIQSGDWELMLAAASELELRREDQGVRAELKLGHAQVVGETEKHELEVGTARFFGRRTSAPVEGLARETTPTVERRPAPGPQDPSGDPEPMPTPTADTAASLLGRVLDDRTGEPVSRFRVGLVMTQTQKRFHMPEVRDFEDAEGRFAWPEVEPADLSLFVHAEGYAVARVRNPQRNTDHEVRLVRGGTARGRVVDRLTDLPVADALVLSVFDAPVESLPFKKADEFLWLPTSTRTRADGTFELHHVAPGRNVLRASHPDYAVSWSDEQVVPDEATADFGTLGIDAGGSVQGVVTQEDGTPLEGGQVVLMVLDTSLLTNFEMAVTDAEGRYRVEHQPATVMLSVLVSGPGAPWVRPVEVHTGRNHVVDFHLGGAGTALYGQVLDARGQPVRFQSLSFFDLHELAQGFNEEWEATATDDEGRYSLRTLKPGRYLVYFVDENGRGLRLVDLVEVREGESRRHDVQLRDGVIRGRVRDARTEAPCAGGMVMLEVESELMDEALFGGFQTIESDGSYAFAGMPYGLYTITAYPAPLAEGLDLGHERTEPVLLDELSQRITRDFELFEGGSAEVQVVDTNDRPVAYAEVFLIDSDGYELNPSRLGLTNERGGQIIRGVRPGRYRVLARANGYRGSPVPFECRPGERGQLRIVLEPLSTVPDNR